MEMEIASAALKDRILQYQRTGEGLSEIVNILARRIYSFPKKKCGWEEDDCGEFFIYFYPRLVRTLKSFKDQDKPFEWYLNSILRWQFKSFCKDKRKIERFWGMSDQLDFWDLNYESYIPQAEETVPREPHLAGILGLDHSGKIKRPSDRKRFLFWVLKYARLLDDRSLDRLSELTGYDRDWLEEIGEELKARLHPREQRLEALKARQNKAFFKARLIEKELLFEAEPEKKELLSSRLKKLKRTILLAQAQIARIPLCSTNRDIGEVLKIPKGTVDTSLYWLKKRLSMLYSYRSEDSGLREEVRYA